MDSKSNSATDYQLKRNKFFEEVVNSKYSREVIGSLTKVENLAFEVFEKITSKAKEAVTKDFIQNPVHTMPLERNKQLYKIIEQMPKGALLHTHFVVTGSSEVLEKLIFSEENLYYDFANSSFNIRKFEKGEEIPKSFSYVPKADNELKELCKRAVIYTKEDAEKPNHWEIFGSKIVNTIKIHNNTKYLKEHILDALSCCVREGLNIVQGRVLFGFCERYGTGKCITMEEELDIYAQAYEEFKRKNPDFSFKIIHILRRYCSNEEILICLNNYLELKRNKKYSEILLGVDLVGDETLAKSINFAPLLDDFRNSLKDKGESHLITYFLHAGESYFEENNNIFDNLLLDCPRIGHGINLIKHSYLFDEIKKRKVNIESCPLSNQILNYISDLRHHPLRTFFNNGISVSISSDDNMVFNTKVINDDFYVCGLLMDFNLLDFKQICFNSIQSAILNKEETEKQLKIWSQRWQEFCTLLSVEV